MSDDTICPICGSEETRYFRGGKLNETTHHECGPCGASYATYSDTQDNALRQLRADNDELRARLEAAERDAARYPITLTQKEVRGIIEFFGGDEDDETEITIGWVEEHESGPGYYLWMTDYPEEGSVPLKVAAEGKTGGERDE